MRNIAFGDSTRCNIKCAHCVAAEGVPDNQKMELVKVREINREFQDKTSATKYQLMSFV